ncbi:MAG: class F sortase [Candidatus Staskawiczbacteria bacterium]|nr:class F sortase [Candidatus Staskawiczbacteria bacterium]
MLSKRTLLITLFVGCVFFLSLLFCFILERSITASPKSIIENVVLVSKPKPIIPGLPLRLKIPNISIDAPIDSVGVTFDGAVDVPKGPADVAWFNLGPRPGDIGSAVITGHYGTWKNGGGSVFDNLNKLIPGDKIYVEDEKGMIITFVVRELRIYGQNEYAPGVFNSDDGKAHLNLITCAGDWIESQKTYSNRLVVFTDKE